MQGQRRLLGQRLKQQKVCIHDLSDAVRQDTGPAIWLRYPPPPPTKKTSYIALIRRNMFFAVVLKQKVGFLCPAQPFVQSFRIMGFRNPAL